MYPSRDSAARARNLLNAWQINDLDAFRMESEGRQEPGGDSEEQERLDLLQGIAEQMQQDADGDHTVCFRLLEHLAASGSHPPMRARKLAFFPR